MLVNSEFKINKNKETTSMKIFHNNFFVNYHLINCFKESVGESNYSENMHKPLSNPHF